MSSASSINLAPRSAHADTPDEKSTVDGAGLPLAGAIAGGAAQRHRLGSRGPVPPDGLPPPPRQRAFSGGDAGPGRVRANSNPGGSVETQRRISRLSRARERENKVPRLVEYFCVVSSVAAGGEGGEGGKGGSGGGTDGRGAPATPARASSPPTPPRRSAVTSVRPMPRTPANARLCGASSANGDTVRPAALGGADFVPRITARYPAEDHEENPLLEDGITAFCHPGGTVPVVKAVKAGGEAGAPPPMPKCHYFVTTAGSGQKMYGTCLTVWEGMEVAVEVYRDAAGNAILSNNRSVQVVYLPRCLVILSVHPYLVAFREYLTQLHRMSKMCPPESDADGEDGGDAAPEKRNGEVIVTSDSLKLKSVLTLPVERYITNFCSELPAPPPGSFQVQTTILDSVISIWSPPGNMPIAWVSLPFAHLFQCLDVENVLTVWTALALERQVLVTSSQLSLLTTCCEILLSLLFPMRWSHAYIPVLPLFLVPILSAPMPFLCGIEKRHLAETMDDLAEECIVVDLDKNQVSLGAATPPLPPLPRFIYHRLRSRLESNVGHVYREIRSLRRADDTSELGIHLDPQVKEMADAMWESRLCLFDEAFMLTFTPEERRKNWLNGDDGSGGGADGKNSLMMTVGERQNLRGQSAWDAVQESFLETYCFLLQKYRRFLVFPSKQNEGAYGGAGFRSQEFLGAHSSGLRDFLEELVGSQMFDDFVTKRLYGSGEADISFFDSAVDRYVKNSSIVANVSDRILARNENMEAGSRRPSFNPRSSDGSIGGSGRQRIRNLLTRASSRASASPDGDGGGKSKDPPLLQSASVKRKLKTIVPPEPCAEDLPDKPVGNAVVVRVMATAKRDEAPVAAAADEEYPAATAAGDTNEDGSVAPSVASASTAASKTADGRVYYHYPTFPEKLDPELFGRPRPMSSAVMAEYDRQRENVGKFRRTSTAGGEGDSAEGAKDQQNVRRAQAITGGPVDKPDTAEVTTFTVFFMTYTAVVGKDLMAVDNDSLDRLDSKNIKSDMPRERTETQQLADMVDEIVMDADLPETPTKADRPPIERKDPPPGKSPVRNRFNDKLSTLKIMEAKETARAELVIAFEMLKMMKERGLRADPEAYQCLIDACGRCGDTGRATQLLTRMHEDGIVADGVVYSSLVSAFSADNAWKQASGEAREELPDWANGASIDMDWNTLKSQKRSYIDIVKEKLNGPADESGNHPKGLRNTFKRIVSRNKKEETDKKAAASYTEQYVTDQVLRQILLGENLLEIVYPDISIDTDNELCPRCNFYLSDDDVVAGWSSGNSQEYKTECPNCLTKFVPHFCVQSTLPSFVGSRGPSSALFCERLSPWVLKKELQSVISVGGIEDLLSPEWRERESKNAVLWWNLILSFMRYRFPFTFLLQGSFSSSLIAPTPDEEDQS